MQAHEIVFRCKQETCLYAAGRRVCMMQAGDSESVCHGMMQAGWERNLLCHCHGHGDIVCVLVYMRIFR